MRTKERNLMRQAMRSEKKKKKETLCLMVVPPFSSVSSAGGGKGRQEGAKVPIRKIPGWLSGVTGCQCNTTDVEPSSPGSGQPRRRTMSQSFRNQCHLWLALVTAANGAFRGSNGRIYCKCSLVPGFKRVSDAPAILSEWPGKKSSITMS